MSGEALVRLRDASLGYGERVVLADVDVDVRAGDFSGILGPNGSGKTTLLRALAGLEPLRRGERVAGGVRIGYVPQRERLDPVFPVTVEEVVRMGAFGRLRGLRRLSAEDRRRAEGCLERVELAARARDPYAALSGGQKQRVLIARALVVRPELLLLDEPTTGIDERSRARVLALLDDVRREERTAVLLVTHDAEELRGLARDVLEVAEGRVVRRELAPATAATAAARTEG